MSPVTLEPIGVVRSARTDPSDSGWGDVVSTIVLDARFDESALRGLEEFSHAEIVFHFHELAEARVCTGARHPRDDPRWPLLGIFAQRGAGRPNRLGVSRARVLAVRGRELDVQGLDAINGTPVLDIKPWLAEFGPRAEAHQPAWCAQVMERYFD
ncbi:MAG TPA: SAM-dependent methyltransferase [Longimicrobiales bacterium]